VGNRIPNYQISEKESGNNQTDSFRIVFIMAILDFFGVTVSFFIPWLGRIGVYGDPPNIKYAISVVLLIVFYFAVSISENTYSIRNFLDLRASTFKALKCMVYSFSMLLLGAFLLKTTADYSRVWGFTWAVLLVIYFILSRAILHNYLKKLQADGRLATRYVVYGDIEEILRLRRNFANIALNGTAIFVGLISAESCTKSQIVKLAKLGLHYLGESEQLEAVLERQSVKDIILIANPDSKKNILALMSKARRRSCNIYTMHEPIFPLQEAHLLRSIGDLALIQIDHTPLDNWQLLLKRCLDLGVASVALVLVAPIMSIVAIAIIIESRGPVFFVQSRYGFNNELIKVLKFRSMFHEPTDDNALSQAIKSDKRITKLGSIIRKLSIDELPQLFNVIRGNMSLVGPRPHALKTRAAGQLFEDVIQDYAARHRIKPGITGLAQINGLRGETATVEDIQKRVELDMHYIKNWKISLDIYILLMTPVSLIIHRKKAY